MAVQSLAGSTGDKFFDGFASCIFWTHEQTDARIILRKNKCEVYSGKYNPESIWRADSIQVGQRLGLDSAAEKGSPRRLGVKTWIASQAAEKSSMKIEKWRQNRPQVVSYLEEINKGKISLPK